MKKTLICVLIFGLLLSLSGCTVSKSFSPLAHEYLISALGFDQNGEEITAVLEAVIVNSEDTNAEKRNELLTGSGSSLETALKTATEKASQPIELSHCAVAVIGNSVSEERFEEICNYLYSEKQITLSILLVSTENAEKLLSNETISSVAVGYDIMSMQDTQGRLSGIDFKNRFYELESKRKGVVNTFSLPYFETDSGGYFIDGMMIFKDDAATLQLDSEQASIYAIATDSQGSGEIILEGKRYNVESAYTACSITRDTAPQISLEAKLQINAEKQIKKQLEAEIKALFSLSQRRGVDIFGIGNIINHKKSDFFRKIKKNYDEFYKNAELEVVVK